MEYEAFFAERYDEVVRTLALAVGDRARAEDAAQEAFAKAYLRWSHVRTLERPTGWVVVVGVNQLRRWITRHDRRFAAGPVATATSPDPTTGLADAEALRAALDRLPPRQRATVVLRHLCDLPTAEVADALGCAEGTVRSALHAGLAALRIDLADEGGTPHPEEVADDARR